MDINSCNALETIKSDTSSHFYFKSFIDSYIDVKKNDDGDLTGYIFIELTGVENENGIPKATLCRRDSSNNCSIGWRIKGKPTEASILYHHKGIPIWLAHDKNLLVPPKGYSFFHWTENTFNNNNTQIGTKSNGYIFQLVAARQFILQVYGIEVLINPGLDTYSHKNIDTRYYNIDQTLSH